MTLPTLRLALQNPSPVLELEESVNNNVYVKLVKTFESFCLLLLKCNMACHWTVASERASAAAWIWIDQATVTIWHFAFFACNERSWLSPSWSVYTCTGELVRSMHTPVSGYDLLHKIRYITHITSELYAFCTFSLNPHTLIASKISSTYTKWINSGPLSLINSKIMPRKSVNSVVIRADDVLRNHSVADWSLKSSLRSDWARDLFSSLNNNFQYFCIYFINHNSL